MFAAEALIFPTGLVTSAFLTRNLGAEGYGLFSLAAMLVAWIEWTLAALFTKPTIRSVRLAADWKPLGTRILHLDLAAGVSAMAALWLFAPALAEVLNAPRLAGPLRLFAVDIPIFTYVAVHRSMLTGLGAFGLRATAVATRWMARLVLILLLVGAGLSVTGAILASIGASLAELVVARRYDRAPLLAWPRVSTQPFLAYAWPLFLAALATHVYKEIDLFALKALGGTLAETGFYAGARNLSIVTSVFTAAFSPLLLATLSRLMRDGDTEHARDMGRDSVRLILLLVPFAALVAGAPGEIVRLVLGDGFAPAGPLLAWLIFAGLAGALVAVGNTILIAGSRPRWALALALPLVPLAILGHLYAIPRWGPIGAAGVTTLTGCLGGAASLAAVHRAWSILPPAASVARSAGLALAAYLVASTWATPGWTVVLKLAAVSTAIPLVFLVMGEFTPRERSLGRSLLSLDRLGRSRK